MWMEERGTAINEERAREAAATGAETLAVACPFCTMMLDDGVKQTGVGAARRRRVGAARGGDVERRLNTARTPAHRMSEMALRGVTVDELESLYRADLPRFLRAAAAIVGDETAGRDAVQEAFAQALDKRASFKGEAPLEAWVWRIVINEALALRRRRPPEFQSPAGNGTAPSTEQLAEQDAMVRAWVASLPGAPAPRGLSPVLRRSRLSVDRDGS